MPELVYVPLAVGELRALVAFNTDGGVVGEEQERDLQSAHARLRAAAEEVVSETNHATPGSMAWQVAVERQVHDWMGS